MTEAAMFLKGFICGWVGLAAIFVVMLWGMTPRVAASSYEPDGTPAYYLHALGGGSLDYLVNRLALLARKPNSYVVRPQQQRANASANCRRQIYELSEKGIRLLQERGLICERQRTSSNFAHELMTC